MQIWNTIRTTQLAQEMEQLRDALDEMKRRIGFDAMDDLEDFENSVSGIIVKRFFFLICLITQF